jgi:hypothetical protein
MLTRMLRTVSLDTIDGAHGSGWRSGASKKT